MAPLKPREIYLLCDTLKHLAGARLERIHCGLEDFAFEFSLGKDSYILWYDDSPVRPFLSFWPGRLPFGIRKIKSPMALFLKAHFVGALFEFVEFQEEWGRVLKLHLSDEKSFEFRLFPRGQNLLVRYGKKKISLHKPKELHKVSVLASEGEELRSVEEFSSQWKESRQMRDGLVKKEKVQTATSPSSSEVDKKKKKLEKAIRMVEEELSNKKLALWGEVGEWLKRSGGFDGLPESYFPFVDQKRSFSWNIENAFTKAKDVRRKKAGTERRLKDLKDQLRHIEASDLSQGPEERPLELSKARGLSKESIKTRSLRLAPDLTAFAGKSAKDNMNLLRKAKSWDLWFHLKDWPSSHAILFRSKNRQISPEEEMRLIQWFFSQTFGKRWTEEKGNKYEVIVAECRFVKPIKGDRQGRVRYHNERTLRVEVK